MLHRSYDDCRADDSHIDQSSGPNIPARQAFDFACEAFVYAVRRGDDDRLAIWYAYYVIREARRLGLYPSTAQLEAECRRAA